MAETEQAPKDLIGFLDFYLVKKAPFQIPAEAREWIVKWGPWIALVLLILSLPPLLLLLGIGAAFIPFAGVTYAAGFSYGVIFAIVQIGLLVLALPGLFARKMSGWRLLFYSRIIGFVWGLMSGFILGAIIGVIIGMYLLFQVRSLYHD